MVFGTLYDKAWLKGGMRTGFADYGGVLAQVSPTDLGIAASRAALAATETVPDSIDTVIGSNVAQSSYDAYYFPRHVGLYCGVPIDRPALLVQRLCTSGFEAILQAADAIKLGKAETALCVGAESMSRNPVASYTLRAGFRMGQAEFKDFLWESSLDTAPMKRMGDTAEILAERYQISRGQVDEFAAESFARALAARGRGYFDSEIMPLRNVRFEVDGHAARGITLPRGIEIFAEDNHLRPTSRDTLKGLKPAFGGVQTGGNSSAIVDGAAAVVVADSGKDARVRIVAGAACGVAPEIMGIGPVPAIRQVLELAGLKLDAIDRFEINEAFGAQYLAVERELGLDRAKVNVNGGAIALGHPLGATGVRCTLTLARELAQSGKRYGVAAACAGGGQGVAILLENTAA